MKKLFSLIVLCALITLSACGQASEQKLSEQTNDTSKHTMDTISQPRTEAAKDTVIDAKQETYAIVHIRYSDGTCSCGECPIASPEMMAKFQRDGINLPDNPNAQAAIPAEETDPQELAAENTTETEIQQSELAAQDVSNQSTLTNLPKATAPTPPTLEPQASPVDSYDNHGPESSRGDKNEGCQQGAINESTIPGQEPAGTSWDIAHSDVSFNEQGIGSSTISPDRGRYIAIGSSVYEVIDNSVDMDMLASGGSNALSGIRVRYVGETSKNG